MFINCILLAISSSIDSLGIGITYGIKNTKIILFAKIILFVISFTISMLSIWFGEVIKNFLPISFTKYIGAFILIFMGLFICFQSVNSKKSNSIDLKNETKIYSFFINFLGITIKIIKNPISSDLDGSHYIDSKEALFLGLALSLDSIGVGIGSSIIGINSYIFPLFVSFFQLCFLSIGTFLGKKLHKLKKMPDNLWSAFSGILLCIIGIIKFFR